MSQTLALQIKGLIKTFGDLKALDGISFDVKQGECFGLLGPNGAGKSTALKMIYGHAEPSGGDVFVLGMNVKDSGREIRSRIGVVPQDEGLDQELTVKENLLIFSKYFGIHPKTAQARAMDLLKMVRLDEVLESRVEGLSGGMKRRLAIARSLLNHPELLVLDEPTVGLDPQVRIWIWEFLQKVKEQGSTVVLTTHYMEEAESLCDRLAIIDKGKILAVGSPKELIQAHLQENIVEFEVEQGDMNYYLNRLKEKKLSYFVVGRQVFVPVAHDELARETMAMITSRKISYRKTGLSDVFLSLAGHDLREVQ